MIALLHMFIRSTVDELRKQAEESDRPGAAPLGSGDVLRGHRERDRDRRQEDAAHVSALPKPPADHVAATQFLMEQRFTLWRTTCHLGTADLVRLNELLAKARPDELRQAATFLEGLVEWRSPAPQSSDAPRP